MTAIVETQITCPGCREELSVKARFFKAPTDSDGEHSVDIMLDLDQASWFEAHDDDNCALKDLTQVEDALGDR